MAINKVEFGGTILIDTSGDTATASEILSGYTAHSKEGTQLTGTADASKLGTASATNSSNTATSLSFSVEGEPKAFALISSGNITLSSGYYYISSILYDGTNHRSTYGYYKSGGGSSRYIYASTAYASHEYSNGTLTVKTGGSRTTAGGSFYNTTYQLIYLY